MNTEALVAALIESLEYQWAANHDEHCSNTDNEHLDGSRCYWPRPSVLDGLESSTLRDDPSSPPTS